MLIHSLQKTELHKQNNKLELPKWFSQQLESEHETIFFTWSLHHKRVKKLQNLLTKIIPIESKSFKAFHFFVGQFLLLWKIKLWFLLFWNSKWFNYLPAVVAWCAYSSVSHSVDYAYTYRVVRMPSCMVYRSFRGRNTLSQ